jgi:hypothetical protein
MIPEMLSSGKQETEEPYESKSRRSNSVTLSKSSEIVTEPEVDAFDPKRRSSSIGI